MAFQKLRHFQRIFAVFFYTNRQVSKLLDNIQALKGDKAGPVFRENK
jgi:hypothetical protein